MAKFRISNHDLQIETGRHMNVPVEGRLCIKCVNEIEDEKHALIFCNMYDKERDDLYTKVGKISDGFRNLDNNGKFIWLMASKHKRVSAELSKFIYNMFALRKEKLSHPECQTLSVKHG
jgi:hypothetical protein